MSADRRGVIVLGSTGSIGTTTLTVLERLSRQADNQLHVLGLSAGHRIDLLIQQARLWQPEVVCITDAVDRGRVLAALGECEVLVGESGLIELVQRHDVDIVVNGLVGAIGMAPTLAAVDAGVDVAMANKEPLVMAGAILLQRAAVGGGRILPVDSEPSAMWQCLRGERAEDVTRLILTASGGAFRGRSRAELVQVTPAQALRHPTWRMGAKITVDCATLMNKGFEVIEAAYLFDVGVDAVDVVLHRESIIHCLVEFVDGSILAHLGRTDMALPIQYALTEPGRRPGLLASLNLAEIGALHFETPDMKELPGLRLCYEVGRLGGSVPAALNGANEEAVAAFLAGKIGFLDIHHVNQHVVDVHVGEQVEDIDAVMAVDGWARREALTCIDALRKAKP